MHFSVMLVSHRCKSNDTPHVQRATVYFLIPGWLSIFKIPFFHCMSEKPHSHLAAKYLESNKVIQNDPLTAILSFPLDMMYEILSRIWSSYGSTTQQASVKSPAKDSLKALKLRRSISVSWALLSKLQNRVSLSSSSLRVACHALWLDSRRSRRTSISEMYPRSLARALSRSYWMENKN